MWLKKREDDDPTQSEELLTMAHLTWTKGRLCQKVYLQFRLLPIFLTLLQRHENDRDKTRIHWRQARDGRRPTKLVYCLPWTWKMMHSSHQPYPSVNQLVQHGMSNPINAHPRQVTIQAMPRPSDLQHVCLRNSLKSWTHCEFQVH